MSAMAQEAAYADASIEVVISGDLDAPAVPGARTLIDQALARRPRLLVIDLAGCNLIDAAGIALLLDVHRRAWRADGRMALRSATPQVRRIMEIARVAHILCLVPESVTLGSGDSAADSTSASRR